MCLLRSKVICMDIGIHGVTVRNIFKHLIFVAAMCVVKNGPLEVNNIFKVLINGQC